MRGAKRSQLPGPLLRAGERFERWRRIRARGTLIPEPLWTLAANLAARYGVCKTASTLRLDYYSLKSRLPESTSAVAQAGDGQAAFLELPASALAAPGECVIECENSAGARMRIQLKGVALADLAALGRSFWSGE
jgi:hypothetical protein